MSSLNVELYGVLLGTITEKDQELNFDTDSSCFDHFPVGCSVMSFSVPLNLRYTSIQRRRYQGFFAELLPEGRNLDWINQITPRERRNTYGLLHRYGKDSAGALLIYDPADPSALKKPHSEKLDASQIRGLLENMPLEPLANSPISGKMSLGGVQGKIILARKNDAWHRTHNGYPSTHILKPVVADFPTMIDRKSVV
jgi:serine/threonine-protein kinase HipA